ncbi:MAG: hypothetical protein Q7J78_04625 [Clostridiales bacterium]|nr:hypothetical protein [Clostridiales bacterium]
MNGRLNLITLKEIYDYFIDIVSEKKAGLKDSAARCLAFCRNELEKEVIKALVVAQVSAGDGADPRLSARDIAFIIGMDDFKAVDGFLKELNANPVSNVIYYEKENRFEFIAAASSEADLQKRLEEEAAGVDPYEALLEVIKEYSNSIFIRALYQVNPSRDILPVRKDLGGVIFRPADLLKALNNECRNIDRDGKIMFAIPSFNDGTSFTQGMGINWGTGFNDGAGELIDNIKIRLQREGNNVCVAVPKEFPYHIERELKLYAAAKHLSQDEHLGENGRKLVQKNFQRVQKSIENEIKQFGSITNFLFIFNNNIIKENFTNLESFERFIVLRHFHKFPRVDAESIRGKNAVHNLIENFLIFGEKVNIPDNYSVEIDRLIMDVLRPLGLVRVERSGSGCSARVKVPEVSENPASKEVWDIVCDTSVTIADVFSLLEEPPYGLPDYMVDLYIAAAVAANRIVIKFKGQYQQLSKSSIAFINSSGYSLEKVITIPRELKVKVKQIWAAFGRLYGRCGAGKFDPDTSMHDSVLRDELSSEMADVQYLLSGLKSGFEVAGIKSRALNELITSLQEISVMKTPAAYLEGFSRLPSRIMSLIHDGKDNYRARNNIDDVDHADDSDDTTSDVVTLSTFDSFIKFVDNIGQNSQEIREIEISMDGLRSLEEIDSFGGDEWIESLEDLKGLDDVEGLKGSDTKESKADILKLRMKLRVNLREMVKLKEKYFELYQMYRKFRSDLDHNIFQHEQLRRCRGALSELIDGYNSAFNRTHEVYRIIVRDLFDLFKRPLAKLIQSFERLGYANIKHIYEIRNEIKGIILCSRKPSLRENGLLKCSCNGEMTNLLDLIEGMKNVQGYIKSVRKQFGNIAANYLNKLTLLEAFALSGVQQNDDSCTDHTGMTSIRSGDGLVIPIAQKYKKQMELNGFISELGASFEKMNSPDDLDEKKCEELIGKFDNLIRFIMELQALAAAPTVKNVPEAGVAEAGVLKAGEYELGVIKGGVQGSGDEKLRVAEAGTLGVVETGTGTGTGTSSSTGTGSGSSTGTGSGSVIDAGVSTGTGGIGSAIGTGADVSVGSGISAEPSIRMGAVISPILQASTMADISAGMSSGLITSAGISNDTGLPTGVTRKIGFRKIYSDMVDAFLYSGFKSLSVIEFEVELDKFIKKIKREYDEIDFGN